MRTASCLWVCHGRIQGGLRRQWRAAKDDAAAEDALLRVIEFDEFADQLKLLTEAYQRGLEMEKNGTGRRLDELPFEAEEMKLPRPPQTKAVSAFREGYNEAKAVLDEGLRLAAAGEATKFAALWSSTDSRLHRRSPPLVLEDLRRRISSGCILQSCPLLVLDAREIEQRADMLAKKGKLRLCWRASKDDYVGIESVEMEKTRGAWRFYSF